MAVDLHYLRVLKFCTPTLPFKWRHPHRAVIAVLLDLCAAVQQRGHRQIMGGTVFSLGTVL